MSLLFCDSFNHYQSADLTAQGKWNANTGMGIAGGNGRTAGYNSLTVSPFTAQYITKSLPNSSTLILGFAVFLDALGSNAFAVFNDTTGGGTQITMQTSGGLIQVFCGTSSGTLLGTSAPYLLTTGAWRYIEIKIVFSTTTTGSVTVQVGGANALTVTGVVTCTTANAYCNALQFYAGGSNNNYHTYCSDLYLLDGTGSVNNDFLGDCTIVTLFPNGAGRVTGFANVGGAANWNSVSERLADYDATYVNSGTVGTEDCYTLATLTTGGRIIAGVQAVCMARNDGSPARFISPGVGNGTTESYTLTAGVAVPSTYTFVINPMNINPLTGVAWASADFTTLQAALKVIS